MIEITLAKEEALVLHADIKSDASVRSEPFWMLFGYARRTCEQIRACVEAGQPVTLSLYNADARDLVQHMQQLMPDYRKISQSASAPPAFGCMARVFAAVLPRLELLLETAPPDNGPIHPNEAELAAARQKTAGVMPPRTFEEKLALLQSLGPVSFGTVRDGRHFVNYDETVQVRHPNGDFHALDSKLAVTQEAAMDSLLSAMIGQEIAQMVTAFQTKERFTFDGDGFVTLPDRFAL